MHWLCLEYSGSEMNIESKKVYGLASGIDLGLVYVFALTKHCGGIENMPVFSAD